MYKNVFLDCILILSGRMMRRERDRMMFRPRGLTFDDCNRLSRLAADICPPLLEFVLRRFNLDVC